MDLERLLKAIKPLPKGWQRCPACLGTGPTNVPALVKGKAPADKWNPRVCHGCGHIYVDEKGVTRSLTPAEKMKMQEMDREIGGAAKAAHERVAVDLWG